jgi:O-antigen/teichoic acid export membrane protein
VEKQDVKTTMEQRNKGLIIFGIVLLIIGLIASVYPVTKTIFEIGLGTHDTLTYPYQTLGIILSIAGIIIVVLGFLYPSHRTLPPPPTNPQQQKTN